jgi:hypothetical protein
VNAPCGRCSGKQVLLSGAHCPDCTHVISYRRGPASHFTFCSCGWRHVETARQNALGRASKERGAVNRHLREVKGSNDGR